jgi:hypothetical protein
MRLAAGTEVEPGQPEVGPRSDGLDVVNLGGTATAVGDAAQRVDFQEVFSQLTPGPVITTGR